MSEMPRAPVEDDIPRVAELMSEHWPEPLDEVTVKRERSSPRIVLELDARLDRESYALVGLTGANRIYAQAGMHVAAQFDIYEKVVS